MKLVVRRFLGAFLVLGVLCFCFAGSIDNSATRPWVRSLIDYVTGTVVPTSSVAHATSADDALYIGTGFGDNLQALYYDDPDGTPIWKFANFDEYGVSARTNQWGLSSGGRLYYTGPTQPTSMYLELAGANKWRLAMGDYTNETDLYEYTFGLNGNVITGNYPNAVFSQTTSVTRLSVGSGFKFDMWTSGGGPWAYFDAMGLSTLDFIPSTVQSSHPLLTLNFFDWYSYFSSDVYVTSNLNVTGTATVSRVVQTTGDWDDLNFPAVESARVGVDDIEFNSASNGLVFKTTCSTNLTDDHELRMVHFPHSWATNTPVKPHIHFVQTSADHTNMFFLRYKWYNNGSIVPSTWTDLGYASNTLAYTSGEMVQIAVWPQIQAVRSISSIMDVKIYRDGSVGTGDVLEKQFDVHIRRDTFGSVAEFTK